MGANTTKPESTEIIGFDDLKLHSNAVKLLTNVVVAYTIEDSVITKQVGILGNDHNKPNMENAMVNEVPKGTLSLNSDCDCESPFVMCFDKVKHVIQNAGLDTRFFKIQPTTTYCCDLVHKLPLQTWLQQFKKNMQNIFIPHAVYWTTGLQLVYYTNGTFTQSINLSAFANEITSTDDFSVDGDTITYKPKGMDIILGMKGIHI